jgi:hypothetical protein
MLFETPAKMKKSGTLKPPRAAIMTNEPTQSKLDYILDLAVSINMLVWVTKPVLLILWDLEVIRAKKHQKMGCLMLVKSTVDPFQDDGTNESCTNILWVYTVNVALLQDNMNVRYIVSKLTHLAIFCAKKLAPAFWKWLGFFGASRLFENDLAFWSGGATECDPESLLSLFFLLHFLWIRVLHCILSLMLHLLCHGNMYSLSYSYSIFLWRNEHEKVCDPKSLLSLLFLLYFFLNLCLLCIVFALWYCLYCVMQADTLGATASFS